MKTRLKQIFPAFFLLASAGCAFAPFQVGEDYVAPSPDMPATWTAPTPTDKRIQAEETSKAKEKLMFWWRQFEDPELEALVDEAFVGNLDLKLAAARMTQARTQYRLATGNAYPTLSASTGATRSKSPATDTQTVYKAGFDAAWEIDLFGRTSRAIEAAAADTESEEANRAGVRVSLIAEVAQSYIELRAYQLRLEVVQKNLAAQQETLQISQWRYLAGLTDESEVEQARTNDAQTRATIPDLQAGLAASKNRLAVLLGKHPGSLNERFSQSKAFPRLPDTVATGIPAETLQQRPDLIALERKLAAETARVGQKQAERWPSLKLGGSFGWQALSYGSLGNSGTLLHALTGTLAAVLLDGGKLKSAVDIQSAVQEQAFLSYQKNILLALEEVENALSAYAADQQRINARTQAYEAARRADELTRHQYASGLVDYSRVLETQRTLLAVEEALVSDQASLRTNLVKLYKALGGGWETGPLATAQNTQGIKGLAEEKDRG